MTDLLPILDTLFLALLAVAVWLLARLVGCHEQRLAALEAAQRRRQGEGHPQRKMAQARATPPSPSPLP
jgi:hypothetical protein